MVKSLRSMRHSEQLAKTPAAKLVYVGKLVTALQNEKLVDKIKALATKKGCKPGQLALAWLQHQGDDVFPIPGTKNPKYLEENIAAFDIKLSKEEMSELENAVPHDAVNPLTVLPHDDCHCLLSLVHLLTHTDPNAPFQAHLATIHTHAHCLALNVVLSPIYTLSRCFHESQIDKQCVQWCSDSGWFMPHCWCCLSMAAHDTNTLHMATSNLAELFFAIGGW